jgi:hypothetical protein
MLLAVMAMSVAFTSCEKEGDITGQPLADHNVSVDGKQDYWIDFTLSDAGSLSQKAQSRFVELRDTTIYGEKGIKIIEHPLYVTEAYARDNFSKVAALSNDENDIVQKVMIPTFCVDTVGGVCHNDFVVTMTLSRDSMRTVIATHSWNASTAFDGQAIINANRNK